MKKQQWPTTLTVELNGSSRQYARIGSTRDAAYFLVDSWTGKRDSTYREAVVDCSKALRGQVDDEIALASFMRAARASQIFVRSASDLSHRVFERELGLALQQSLRHDVRADASAA